MSFRVRAAQALKRRLVNHIGVVSHQRYHLDSFMMLPRQDVERIGLYANEVDTSCRLPADGTKFGIHYRPRFAYRIDNATVDPTSGLVYDARGEYIAESSSWQQLRLLYSWPRPSLRPPQKPLRGEYIFLPNDGYFHWLTENLPPVIAALKMRPNATILVPKATSSYARDFLRLVDNARVEITKPTAVESLVMVGKIAGHGLSPHPKDAQTLKDFFKPWLSTEPPTRKIYLSRIGETRSPRNERDLLELLVDRGFDEFRGREMSLVDQARLFSEAAQIVGIHGASFSNLTFATSPRVCELFKSAHLPACYTIQAKQCGAHYLPLVYDRERVDIIGDTVFADVIRFIGR